MGTLGNTLLRAVNLWLNVAVRSLYALQVPLGNFFKMQDPCSAGSMKVPCMNNTHSRADPPTAHQCNMQEGICPFPYSLYCSQQCIHAQSW
jgi:hypothetical protein